MENKRNNPATYFSLFGMFRILSQIDEKTASLDDIRFKASFLLLIDSMGRIGDLENIYRETITFSDNSVELVFHQTKEVKAQEANIKITVTAPSPIYASTNTVNALREYKRRTDALKIQKIELNYLGKPVKYTPLFIRHTPVKAGQDLLGLSSERLSKLIQDAINKAYPPTAGMSRWRTHDVRGATASKAHNLGADVARVCRKARWKGEATFFKSYFRACTYRERDTAMATNASIEDLLRMQATRV